MAKSPKSHSGIPSADRNRLTGLDAARGAAMTLVCLAHFQDAYLDPLGVHEAEEALSSTPWQKLPPGPDFLLCYLGLALWLVTACLWLERMRPGALEVFAMLGRNSLFVFVAQYFMYYALIFSLHLHYTRLCPLIFAVSFLVLILVTFAWQRANGQRFLTVGYPGLATWAGRLRAAR